MSKTHLQQCIRERTLEAGFDVVGFASPEIEREAGERLMSFLKQGYHGDMGWLAAKADRRVSPRALWPEVGTVIVVGTNYGPDHDPLERLETAREAGQGNISVYARNDDYHDLMKRRLKSVGRWICETFDCDVKVFVDTAPVLEKPIAQTAGVGWQGKHTNLVSRQFGSWLFLGEIYTTLDIEPDEALSDHCGSCRRCLDVCPTDAFDGPNRLDARKCISYLTIEHKGHIEKKYRKAIGTRIYGCDDCLSVCPWNKFAKQTKEDRLKARSELEAPQLSQLVQLNDEEFRALFRKTAIQRTGHERFIRNTLIAIGNTGDAALAPSAEAQLRARSPLIRAMAVWALKQLLDEDSFRRLRMHHEGTEADPDVKSEWSL